MSNFRFNRRKTGVVFDSFLGKEAVRWMRKPDFPKGGGPVFNFRETTWQQKVKRVQAKAGIPGVVTPHCLRKFFSNQLKLTRVGDPAWHPAPTKDKDLSCLPLQVPCTDEAGRASQRDAVLLSRMRQEGSGSQEAVQSRTTQVAEG